MSCLQVLYQDSADFEPSIDDELRWADLLVSSFCLRFASPLYSSSFASSQVPTVFLPERQVPYLVPKSFSVVVAFRRAHCRTAARDWLRLLQ